MTNKPEDINGGPGTFVAGAACLATIGLALWGMKKISESTRGTKLSWMEFLCPDYNDFEK